MKENIIRKLQQLHRVVNDSGATESEKKTAQHFIDHFTSKYDIDMDFNDKEEEREYKKVCKNGFHTSTLVAILRSYDIRAYYYRGKGNRKNKVYFKATPTMKDLIYYELDVHYRNIHDTFKGIMAVYHHKFIDKPPVRKCEDCKFQSNGKCFMGVSDRHMQDVTGMDACESFIRDKSKNDDCGTNSKATDEAIQAAFLLFDNKDYSTRKGIE